jgi:outer membrane receptor for ferrienterochelin and colicins
VRQIKIIILYLIFAQRLEAQTITGMVTSNGEVLEMANVGLVGTTMGASTNANGYYQINHVPLGEYQLTVSILGYETQTKKVVLTEAKPNGILNFVLPESSAALGEVVISGTMKEVSRTESPVPVEVYSAKFFEANVCPSVFESLQNVNGVRPQLNCNVCNTGDIHINGLEGPYTMVLIDGMPIVSGLSTVYGLTGIPQSLIERVEIVKGPASTLYGSEAVGGLINIITKKPSHAPLFSADVFATSWGEVNTDLGAKFKIGKHTHALLGVNYFNYQVPIDRNKDGFTDLTLQNRISVFNKWSFERKNNRQSSIAGRYVYEDRWGGQTHWNKSFRGSDSIYGESIYTSRWELFGIYQLPVKEIINLQISANGHQQNSFYGTTAYNAEQYIVFGQLTWNKAIGQRHDLLVGSTLRYTYYNDNTPATAELDAVTDAPSVIYLPGLFVQDEIGINEHNKLLLGVRYDYNSAHGSIITPRINYKWNSLNKKHVVRISAGNGYRVANVFTEDHAALTGAREVVFTEALKPETSWNGNINYVRKIYARKGVYIGVDATAWYTYFTNRIIPDYETDPNKIIYNNLDGFSQSTGGSVNVDVTYKGFTALMGFTAMDVSIKENGQWQRQLLTERFTGVWSIGYTFRKAGVTVDYTGNLYGPMRLPLLSDLDNRSAHSPWFSIQNIQVTKKLKKGWEIYGGIKNLLNYTPPANSIARAHDPFDKEVQFDAQGQVLPTPNNPNALTFDPNYVFASNQGIRGFVGVRYVLQK